jgi:hypothetical protein
MERSTGRYSVDMRAKSLGKTMEGAKDHPDTEVHGSDKSAELDSMDRIDTSREDDSQSETHSAVDLSGLYELRGDASVGTQVSLIGESGLWPEFDDTETQTDHRLDTALDNLCVPDSKIETRCEDEIRSVSDDSGADRSLDLACPSGDGRFTETVMDLTGWSLDKSTISDEPLFCPVFTDGEKTYEFADWKIHITFRRTPGIAILDWSPETLEDDVGRAASLVILKSHNAEDLAGILKRHFSSQHLRRLLEILAEKIDG